MYKVRTPDRTQLKSVERMVGETIEQKVDRVQNNGEPIKDSAPKIYTEKDKGVEHQYNVRTDRFEIAAEAMDRVVAMKTARSAEKALDKGKVIPLNPDKGAEGETGG